MDDTPDDTPRQPHGQFGADLARTRRFGVAAILVAGLGLSFVMQTPGWAQTSYYAMVRALSDGTARIDRWHWETKDKSWIDGHFYSVKAPGLPMIVLPAYQALEAAGGIDLSRSVARRAIDDGVRKWYSGRPTDPENSGYDPVRARAIPRNVADTATMIWALGLIGSLLPAIAMMLMARSLCERFEPGTGAASSLALGLGTLILPFSVQLMGHVLATALLFGGFVLLVRERDGPARLPLVAAAGLLCGLAVFVEYPLAFGGAVVGLYGALRAGAVGLALRSVVSRGIAFAAGVIVGVLPVALYNRWAFGSPTEMSYSGAVAKQGRTGHDEIGLNDSGFFGIGVPRPANLFELLFAPRGLVTVTPVVVAAAVGVVLMHRRGHRAESRTALAIALLYLVYVSGYWLPFGGGTPGPRFLIPMLPFLVLGLPFAWKRLPSTTLLLATAGGVVMTIATVTYPLVGHQSLWRWWVRIEKDVFEQTVFTALGFGNGFLTVVPTVLVLCASVALASVATRGLDFRSDLRWAAGAFAAWLATALFVSRHVDEHAGPKVLDAVPLPWQVVAIAASFSLALLGVVLARQARGALGSGAGGRPGGGQSPSL